MGCGLCGANQPNPAGQACPACGALPREALLAGLLARAGLLTSVRVLEVGPSAAQCKFFPPRLQGPYTAIDVARQPFHGEIKSPHRFLPMNLSRLSFSDHCFDLILCSHVLQEVRSDFQAMSQIHRCLKVSGVAVLTVPLEREKTGRNHQEEGGAVAWEYGADFFERLEASGLFPLRMPAGWAREPAGEAVVFAFKYRESLARFAGAL